MKIKILSYKEFFSLGFI